MGRWVLAVLFAALVAVPAIGAEFVEAPHADVQSSGVAAVRWVVSPPVSSFVVFGPFDTFPQTGARQIAGPAPVVASNCQTAAVELDGLKPGTRYAFQVILNEDVDADQTRSLVGEFTTPGTQTAAARGAPIAASSTGRTSPKSLLNWSSRPPLPIPEEPVLQASLTFLALFAALLFYTFSK